MSAQTLGRVSLPPHPVLFRLFYEPGFADDQRTVLPHLLRIDAAHLVMLAHRGILPAETVARLLSVNRDLRLRSDAGETVFETPASHRGLYLTYENEYIHRLGGEVGGSAHVARSRNDINATVTRMRLRTELLGVLAGCESLSRTLSTQAHAHARTVMSSFTHQQPAQPSTFGHYLTAVLSEFVRGTAWLAASYGTVNRSPMGAAAGGGTSFPIDPHEVARLLGFSAPVLNSADAVGSRDFVIQVLGPLALMGTTLTRLANDLQSWASMAYGFLDWPDDLVSTSSIMPQKRNAFVLEHIRGQAVHPTGALMNALMGLKNTPFTNSVEVSGEVSAHLWPALRGISKAVQLMDLLLQHVRVRPDAMRAFLVHADTTMTAVADHLVARHGLAFRTAHDVVARLVARKTGDTPLTAAEARHGLEALLLEVTSRAFTLDEAELARALEPATCVEASAHGGGPAPASVLAQLAALEDPGLTASLQAWRVEQEDARGQLEQAVTALLTASGFPTP
ncbi:argininosuccinate lyase [Corallococcus sp. AB038B]|uniref:argininosuccinate lyase n=1 Tax=Corallococcus sp. AB038B TaxID=2316718 RepID=UPI001F36537A|nr:argininosuccinate lyase [Corallococcus sp. AB038B]